MGGVVGTAANDVGSFIGNAFAAPFKAILGRSCENVCSGPWDLECFIEHFCIPDLAKLVMISGLCFLILVFFYLLFKLGICQCFVKSLCKMSCAACEAYWCTIGDMVCFLCHKLKNTKRVYRRRRRRLHDIEAVTYSSNEELGLPDRYSHRNISRKRRRSRSRRREGEREKIGLESSHYHRHQSSHRSHIKLKSREVSVRIGGKSRRGRSRRKLEVERRSSRRRKIKVFKKRKV